MSGVDQHLDSQAAGRMAALGRSDKWFLADGQGAIWAPPFPVWLREPGFWDHATVYDATVAPLFSVALVDQCGREVPLQQVRRHWQPDRLVCQYVTEAGLELTETRRVAPNGRFQSAWSWQPTGDRLFLVAFTAQPSPHTVETRCDGEAGPIRWRANGQTRRDSHRPTLHYSFGALDADNAVVSCAMQRCQGTAVQPRWALTPFAELWSADRGLVPQDLRRGMDDRGLDFYGLSVALPRETGRPITFELQVTLKVDQELPEQPADHWLRHFDSYPSLSASDPYLERYFDYRVYGLHLCEVRGPVGYVKHRTVAEGIDYFHVPITYSGQCIMFETRWSHDPAVAAGTLLNFIDNQKPDGSFHGRIYTHSLEGTDFYHANWGDAALAVDAIHPNNAFLARAYDGLTRYLDWLCTTRDTERSGMIDALNHFETGQEFMSRYQVVNANADAEGWGSKTPLKAIDATVYAYQLTRALERMAVALRRTGDRPQYADRADRMGRAILENMWDPRTGMFSDVEPTTMTRTGIKAAVCFYPMLTDLLGESHVAALLDHLTSEKEFATPWPLPSSSVDDPEFDPRARWRGKRHACPWNGRVWPMTNSHVIEGLIRQWRRRGEAPGSPRHRCGELAGQWLTRFIHLMFHDGDLNRPNCFEHYNPFTGQPCEYRGINDYQHSCVLDLLIGGLMGIHVEQVNPRLAQLVVDPLPMDLEHAAMRRLRVRGIEVEVARRGDRFSVVIDGDEHRSTLGERLTVPLAPVSPEMVVREPGVLLPLPGKDPAGVRP